MTGRISARVLTRIPSTRPGPLVLALACPPTVNSWWLRRTSRRVWRHGPGAELADRPRQPRAARYTELFLGPVWKPRRVCLGLGRAELYGRLGLLQWHTTLACRHHERCRGSEPRHGARCRCPARDAEQQASCVMADSGRVSVPR